jgi:hypothetical protein
MSGCVRTNGGNILDVADEPDAVVLDDQELQFLRAAMLEWGGPANATDELAVALGFASVETMSGETWALWKRIEAGEVLSNRDWRRVLLAAEIVFASDVVGSGLDWPVTSGISDAESVAILSLDPPTNCGRSFPGSICARGVSPGEPGYDGLAARLVRRLCV